MELEQGKDTENPNNVSDIYPVYPSPGSAFAPNEEDDDDDDQVGGDADEDAYGGKGELDEEDNFEEGAGDADGDISMGVPSHMGGGATDALGMKFEPHPQAHGGKRTPSQQAEMEQLFGSAANSSAASSAISKGKGKSFAPPAPAAGSGHPQAYADRGSVPS